MRTRWWGVSALGLVLASIGHADTIVSDQPSALLVYPFVAVERNGLGGADTIIELSNTSDQPVAVKCYYVNALGRCSDTGDACFSSLDCEGGVCSPQCAETDFTVYLTPFQPIAWLASKGLASSDIPLDGVFRRGIGGSSNAGTRVPAFGIDSVNLGGQAGIGELKCYTVNPDGTPAGRNVLKGHFSVVGSDSARIQVGKASAVGFRALPEAVDGDNRLVLGGEGAEYDACPAVLVLDHFFDGATDPVSGNAIGTDLVLVPCTQNFLTQAPTRTPVQYLVFNEFEQRFSTSAPVDCFFFEGLSSIDTPNRVRSIFSAAVAGTMTGQTRIRGVRGGLVGTAIEFHGLGSLAAFNLHVAGFRTESDVITVAP